MLTEGPEDKSSYKAVIMVGGPGSGKSHFLEQLYQLPKNFRFTPSGFKLVNMDYYLEFMLKKRGISPDFRNLTPEQEHEILSTDNPNSLRSRAKRIRDRQLDLYSNNGLGIILDTTGANLRQTYNTVNRLKRLGYDVQMVFIDTPLQVALERNNARLRKVPESVVVRSHARVRRNIDAFKKIFKDQFVEVKNTDDEIAQQSLMRGVEHAVKNLVNSPVKNPVGRLKLRKRGGRTFTKGMKKKLGLTRRTRKQKLRQILNQKIVNPETQNTIKVRSALTYDKNSQAYKAAIALLKEGVWGRIRRGVTAGAVALTALGSSGNTADAQPPISPRDSVRIVNTAGNLGGPDSAKAYAGRIGRINTTAGGDSVQTTISRDMQMGINKGELALRTKGIDTRGASRSIQRNPDGTYTVTVDARKKPKPFTP